MKKKFGVLPTGEETHLYTICCGELTAMTTNYGAALVELWVPGADGSRADVVLGYDDCVGYACGSAFLGATVGRNANRIAKACFVLNGETVRLGKNENGNNNHSGPDFFHKRIWQVERHCTNAITFRLNSPHGDQGFPGNAVVRVTYTLEDAALRIRYEAICDRDTVFNLTNHSYWNLAGHEQVERAMDQTLMMPAEFFLPDDAENIPTGELRSVMGTPMDFRQPKPLGRDINADYVPLRLQGGYDHCFAAQNGVCAVLADPGSGRTMEVSTDCPGIMVYTANFTDEAGKRGVHYKRRSGVALETQFWPDSVNRPQWQQPITKTGQVYTSETVFRFRYQ